MFVYRSLGNNGFSGDVPDMFNTLTSIEVLWVFPPWSVNININIVLTIVRDFWVRNSVLPYLNAIDLLFLGISWPKTVAAGSSVKTASQAHCRWLWVPSQTQFTCESQTTIRAFLMTLFSIIRLWAFHWRRDVSYNQFTGPLDASLGQLTSLYTLWGMSGSVCGCAFAFMCTNPHS